MSSMEEFQHENYGVLMTRDTKPKNWTRSWEMPENSIKKQLSLLLSSIAIRWHTVKRFSKKRVFPACWVSLGHKSIHCGKKYPTDVSQSATKLRWHFLVQTYIQVFTRPILITYPKKEVASNKWWAFKKANQHSQLNDMGTRKLE